MPGNLISKFVKICARNHAEVAIGTSKQGWPPCPFRLEKSCKKVRVCE